MVHMACTKHLGRAAMQRSVISLTVCMKESRAEETVATEQSVVSLSMHMKHSVVEDRATKQQSLAVQTKQPIVIHVAWTRPAPQQMRG